MFNTQVLAFIGIAAILTMAPGADTMLVIRNVLARGQRAGVLTALGVCSGLFFHATLSALGLSIILVRSAAIFEVVKVLGACYLLFLGGWSVWQMLRSHTKQTPPAMHDGISAAQHISGWRSVREGVLSNVLNPKVAVFYLAFLPQFISPGDPVLAKSLFLAAIHFLLGIVWLSFVTVLLGRLRALLARPTVRRGLEAVTGAVLIAFGVRLLAEHR